MPLIVELIDELGKREFHKVYLISYVTKLVKEIKKFKNPLIIRDNSIIEEFNYLPNLFSSYHLKFKIIDKQKIDYKEFFENQKKMAFPIISNIILII